MPSKRDLEKDYIAFNLVDELLVRCIHENCQWVGPFTLSKKHQRHCLLRPKKIDMIRKDNVEEIDLEKEDDNSTKTNASKILPKPREDKITKRFYPMLNPTIIHRPEYET